MNWKSIVQKIARCGYIPKETIEMLKKLLRGPPEYKLCTVEEIKYDAFFSEVNMDDLLTELVDY